MPIVLKFGSLNLLEPSEPVQACNVIVLPFFFSAEMHCLKLGLAVIAVKS
jgi:hypothetical protein